MLVLYGVRMGFLCVCVCPNVNVCVGMSTYSFCSCVVPSIGFYCFENSCVHLFGRCFISYSLVFVVVATAAALTAIPGKYYTTENSVDRRRLLVRQLNHVLLCIQQALHHKHAEQSCAFAHTHTHTDRHTCCSFVDYFPLFFILYFVRFLLLLLLFTSSRASSVYEPVPVSHCIAFNVGACFSITIYCAPCVYVCVHVPTNKV